MSCSKCSNPSKFVCFCNDVELCETCLTSHFTENPTENHRPVPTTSPEIVKVMKTVNDKRKSNEQSLIQSEFEWLEQKQKWAEVIRSELDLAKTDAIGCVDRFKELCEMVVQQVLELKETVSQQALDKLEDWSREADTAVDAILELPRDETPTNFIAKQVMNPDTANYTSFHFKTNEHKLMASLLNRLVIPGVFVRSKRVIAAGEDSTPFTFDPHFVHTEGGVVVDGRSLTFGTGNTLYTDVFLSTWMENSITTLEYEIESLKVVGKSKFSITFGVASEIIAGNEQLRALQTGIYACEWTFYKHDGSFSSSMYYKKYDEEKLSILEIGRKTMIKLKIDFINKVVKFFHNGEMIHSFGGVPEKLISYIRLGYDRTCSGSIKIANVKIKPE